MLANSQSIDAALLISVPSAIIQAIKGFRSTDNLIGSHKIWATLMRDTQNNTLFDDNIEVKTKIVNLGCGKWYPENPNPMSVSIPAGVMLNILPQNTGNSSPISPLPNKSHQVIKKPIIGRNEKCPCNSGKKYKNCCGK